MTRPAQAPVRAWKALTCDKCGERYALLATNQHVNRMIKLQLPIWCAHCGAKACLAPNVEPSVQAWLTFAVLKAGTEGEPEEGLG